VRCVLLELGCRRAWRSQGRATRPGSGTRNLVALTDHSKLLRIDESRPGNASAQREAEELVADWREVGHGALVSEVYQDTRVTVEVLDKRIVAARVQPERRSSSFLGRPKRDLARIFGFSSLSFQRRSDQGGRSRTNLPQ
jgi:hypothetical protein